MSCSMRCSKFDLNRQGLARGAEPSDPAVRFAQQMLGEVRLRPHHPLRPDQHAGEKRKVAQLHLPGPVAPGLAPAEVEDRATPGLAVEFKKPLRPKSRLPE